MKRILSLVLTLTLVFSLSACGKDNTASTIDGDSDLKNSTPDKEKPSFSDYVGMWSESDISFEKGGLILEISIEDKLMKLNCSSTSSGPDSQVAEFSKSIEISQIKNNSVEVSYDEDGWGNSGVLELTFNDEYILADFKDVIMDEMANWGFYERTYKLIKNEKAQEIITQGSNDYYENNPVEITPTYDTSKASGILASLGMTEQEFRDSCIFVTDSSYNAVDENMYVTLDNLKAYPGEYENKHFVAIDSVYSINKIVSGERDIADNSVKVNRKDSTDDGYYFYEVPVTLSSKAWWEEEMAEVIIIDFRDNMTSPNITAQDRIVPYMIFKGLHNDVPLFWLISVDVEFD